MATSVNSFTIVFPQWYDARCAMETPSKGYLSDVVVQLEDGSRYKLYFSDPVRLQQTLEDDAALGKFYYTEPGLVVLPEVTTAAIEQVVPELVREGYFRHLNPIN